MRGDRPALEALVSKAWAASLPCPPVAPAASWREAGGDSIGALHLLFRLERALKRKLAFDLLSDDMTVCDLTDRLCAENDLASAEGAPVIFMVPGIYGDEPILADFRRALADELRFEIIDLPGLDAPASELQTIRGTCRYVVEEISRCAPDGTLILGGFSFGANVAYEAAAELRARGRAIDLLIILDGAPTTPSPPSRSGGGSGGEGAGDQRRRRADRAASALLALWGADDGRRGMLMAAAKRLGLTAALYVRRRLLQRFRHAALKAWRPRPTTVPLLVAMSEELFPRSYPVWAALAPCAEVVRLPGAHLKLFAPAALAILRPILIEAVARARMRGL